LRKFPVAREAWTYVAILMLPAVAAYLFFIPGFIVILLAIAGVIFFFRNPRRVVPQQPGLIVSPADGKVIEVAKVTEDQFLNGPALKISIFLNIFNVHINRMPIAGEIGWVRYFPGKHLPAFNEEASRVNERNYVAIDGECKVLVTQIAGLVARRVVCDVDKGRQLKRGQIFGLIKFGSCTEVYVPADVEVLVSKGETVKGGETVLGRLKM